MSELLSIFQSRVREALRMRAINQSELARRMGVERSTVSQYLTGRNSPGFDVVERFAKALELRPSILVNENSIGEKIAG